MTFGSPVFREITPGGYVYDTDWTAPDSETKAGTIVIADSSSDKTIKVVDVSATDTASLTYYPMVLLQDVRTLSTDRPLTFEQMVGEWAYTGGPVRVAVAPGAVFQIGQQVSDDGQAGWVGTISAGDILYVHLDSDSGEPTGGISNAASVDVGGTTYYAQPVGIAKNSVSDSSDILTWVYLPQVKGA